MEDKTTVIRKDSDALSDFLQKYQKHEKATLIDRLCEGCMVPRYTVHNWIRGLARIPQLHKCKIEEILGETIFDSLEKSEK